MVPDIVSRRYRVQIASFEGVFPNRTPGHRGPLHSTFPIHPTALYLDHSQSRVSWVEF
ncbi:hypothetical protein ZHAS_00007564 [Anopheles sinensis]|uniref:Uncharacterized protein n=1 Tax=Anopheles sinensis TaxID=74873 RepID=A0A084VQE7_ANOSI|nr:hypothetical protein ZHAS_00007564 [Anopheles sinensis]